VRNYYPASTDDEVLQEVWKIKDETAKRFRSVADHVRSLQRPSPASHAMSKLKRAKLDCADGGADATGKAGN
jgi:hypothetical protein